MTVTDAPSTASAGSAEPDYRFLRGNFAPVGEERTECDLVVDGAIPPALAGRYVRTGPNPIDPDDATHHWFVGDGMLHGVRLEGGGASWYRNRWVRTDEVATKLGEPASLPREAGGLYEGSGNTNVVHHAGRLWAITEGALPIEIDGRLDAVRASNFGGPLPAGINAHPKFDPVTNEMHVVSYTFVPPFAYYNVIGADGTLLRSVELDPNRAVMMHDMALTASRAIVFDLPVLFSMELAMAGKPLPFAWDPDYTPRIGLLPREGDLVQWIELDEACYVYHPLNAYDADDGSGRIVLDLVVHPRAFDDANRGDPSQGDPSLQRWTIDPAAGKVDRQVVSDRGQEFPRADERRATLEHRFGYSVGFPDFDSIGALTDAPVPVLKHDLAAGTTTEKLLGAGVTPSEMVFVPAGPDAGEDEGWLMGYTFDMARGASDLVILDAHDWGSPPVATVHLPVRVPAGFHGNWIPDSAIS